MRDTSIHELMAKWVRDCLEQHGSEWIVVDAYIREQIDRLGELEQKNFYGQIDMALIDPIRKLMLN